MAELFFIATTIFVAYVILDVLGKNDNKTTSETSPNETTPDKTAETSPNPPPLIQPIAKTTKSKSSSTKAANKTAAPTAITKSTDGLKNPKTGEIAKMPTNYAFTKRWIKDALVEEGLLEKVYKNNELDNEAQAKIQAALLQLKAMPKYQ